MGANVGLGTGLIDDLMTGRALALSAVGDGAGDEEGFIDVCKGGGQGPGDGAAVVGGVSIRGVVVLVNEGVGQGIGDYQA